MVRKLLLKLLWIYQKFFTLIGFGSCRYYPTCSEYAKIHFENSKISTAFYHTFIRILRCNQLFEGGIEYPIIKKNSFCPKNMGIEEIKYWLVPKGDNYFYTIKNFSFKG
jgi:putative membrane protein insertion efficiency factor